MTTWEAHVEAWSRLPIDDQGYYSSEGLFSRPDHELKRITDEMKHIRYSGWRNYENKWRDLLGLDSIRDKDILDFGCGIPVDSSELALAGNRVSLADLNGSNLSLASRVLGLYGIAPEGEYLVTNEYPFLQAESNSFDVFFCNGVLHHSRQPVELMARAHELLRTGGEVRLMVYSDIGWRTYIETEPPEDVESDPNFETFVRIFDQTGTYADWYNRKKLQRLFGHLFTITRCEYITDNDRYLAAVLTKKTQRRKTK